MMDECLWSATVDSEESDDWKYTKIICLSTVYVFSPIQW